MRQSVFVARRQQGWERLAALLSVAERRGLRGLAPEELDEMGRLYRWATSDLAYADGHGFDPSLRAYLNRLTARAHGFVYGAQDEPGGNRFWRFVTVGFPSEVRRSRWYELASAALFAGAAALAYWLIITKPMNAYALLPAQMIQPLHKSLHDSNFLFDRDLAPLVSTEIMTNNVRIAIYSFAGGALLAIPTLYLLVFNGLMVGGLGALYTNAGFGYDFWATVAPHGCIELTAIVISAAAGMMLAAPVFNPGQLRRIDALKRNARRAGVLILGVCGMLVIAASIEAFFSPLRFPPLVRLSVGASTIVAMIAYFGFAGRGAEAAADQSNARDLTST
ncbi:MAG TPA: stage II sporulation protein M [Candidatus Eremiobacteraceae bacterium]|nr:stage II sporulation protein M [Candidatus Eremiobacteraceae bacterium]